MKKSNIKNKTDQSPDKLQKYFGKHQKNKYLIAKTQRL
jgi:hypothetical protein